MTSASGDPPGLPCAPPPWSLRRQASLHAVLALRTGRSPHWGSHWADLAPCSHFGASHLPQSPAEQEPGLGDGDRGLPTTRAASARSGASPCSWLPPPQKEMPLLLRYPPDLGPGGAPGVLFSPTLESSLTGAQRAERLLQGPSVSQPFLLPLGGAGRASRCLVPPGGPSGPLCAVCTLTPCRG